MKRYQARGRTLPRLAPLVLAALLGRAAVVHAQAESESAAPASSAVALEKPDFLILPQDGSAGRLRLRGRVLMRASFAAQERSIVNPDGVPERSRVESLDLTVPSARLGARYQAPLEWLSGEVEIDAAGRAELKDGYIEAKHRPLAVRVGQFKPPISAIELDSQWDLPAVGRGFLHELLVDWLDVAGRRPGIELEVRGKGGVKPRLTLGVFQGSTLVDIQGGERDTDLIVDDGLSAQSLAARAEVRIKPVEIGVFYEHRVGSPRALETHHYLTAGADLVLEQKTAAGALRLWMDAVIGESWYEHQDKPVDQDDALFVSARAIGAYRFGGTGYGEPYLEPYAQLGILDPDLEVKADAAWEVALGVNVGSWDLVRLTLQGAIHEGERNFPEGYLAGREPDRFSLSLQAGAAF